jgi:hypothetical protein
MSVSNAWTTTTPASAARVNRVSVITDTGANLAALDKTKHKIVTCSSTGSGFTLNHAYLFTEDGTTAIDLGLIAAHDHTGSTDGGLFVEIIQGNSDYIDLLLTKTTDLYEASWASPVYWIKTVTGTGSVENATDGSSGERSIRLRPNGTSGSGSTVNYPHLKMAFGGNALFTSKLQIETATSVALHAGIQCDDVTAADSNTRKLQAEVCTVTNNNWWLRTANGSANSSSDTGVAITSNRVGITIEHNPLDGTANTTIFIDGTQALQKTTNIPTSSNTASDNLVKFSVKNNTAADRPLKFYGCRLFYKVEDSWD